MDKPAETKAQYFQGVWEGMKGFVGILLVSAVLVGIGMQVQSWLNAEERAQLRRQYSDDLQKAQSDYERNAKNRTDIVDEVRLVSAETLRIQRETLELVQKLAPQTTELAKTAKRIDRKAGEAVRESKKARAAADQAVDAVQDSVDTATLNAKIQAANKRSR